MNPSNINQGDFNQHCFKIARLFPQELNNYFESNQLPIKTVERLTRIHKWLSDIYDFTPASEDQVSPTYEDFVAACVQRCDPQWSIPCAQPQTDEDWELLNYQIDSFRNKIKAAFDCWGFEVVYQIDITSDEFAEIAVDALDSFISKHKSTLQALPFDLRHDLLAALFTPNNLSNMQALTTYPCIALGTITGKQEDVASLWARRRIQKINSGRAVRTVTPAFDTYLDSPDPDNLEHKEELKAHSERAMSRA